MRDYWSEIVVITGRQWHLEPYRHGCNAAISVALGAPTGQIEKFSGLFSIGAFECCGIRQQAPSKCLSRGRKRPAKKLIPRDGIDSQCLASTQPAHHLLLLGTARHERINQEVRVEVNHGARIGEALPPRIRHGVFPGCRTFHRQSDLVLQLAKHLQRLRN